MRLFTCAVGILLLCLTVSAVAQGPPGAPGAPPVTIAPANEVKKPQVAAAQLPPEIEQNRQMLVDAGLEPGQALVLSLLASGEVDPMTFMMIMGIMGGGGGGDMGDLMGMLMFSQMAGKGGQAAQPNWFRDDTHIYLLEEESLYKIDYTAEPMQVVGVLKYKKSPNLLPMLIPALMPAVQGAREKARATSCLSNVKQLTLGMIMYAQDHDETLPGENWVEETFPYVKNRAIFKCPSRPDVDVGYAFNEKLPGAELKTIENPAETVALFESNTGGANPIGNAADVPDGGVHNGRVNLGFVYGHAKLVPVAEARKLLEQPPF